MAVFSSVPVSLCSKSSFFHPVQWSSKRNRQWLDAILWCWFAVPLVFKDWQLLASGHLYWLPECSYYKKRPQFYCNFFFSFKGKYLWNCILYSARKKNPKNTECASDHGWPFGHFLLVVTWQLLRWSGLSLDTLCFLWYFSYHCLSGFGLQRLLTEGSICLRDWFLCCDTCPLRLPLKSFLRLSVSHLETDMVFFFLVRNIRCWQMGTAPCLLTNFNVTATSFFSCLLFVPAHYSIVTKILKIIKIIK